MEIMCVKGDLVCSRRVPGLLNVSLKVLETQTGGLLVATDPVSAPAGQWVFITTGSAARVAMPDAKVTTDLTVCGIIDDWQV